MEELGGSYAGVGDGAYPMDAEVAVAVGGLAGGDLLGHAGQLGGYPQGQHQGMQVDAPEQ